MGAQNIHRNDQQSAGGEWTPTVPHASYDVVEKTTSCIPLEYMESKLTENNNYYSS